jgi:hypothetical protein
MKTNIGPNDAAVRFAAGMLMLSAGTYYSSWWAFLGLVPLASAVSGFCPLYRACHIDTSLGGGPCDHN